MHNYVIHVQTYALCQWRGAQEFEWPCSMKQSLRTQDPCAGEGLGAGQICAGEGLGTGQITWNGLGHDAISKPHTSTVAASSCDSKKLENRTV